MREEVCLVLGGNGFIGSHVVDKLAATGQVRVRVLDLFARPAQFAASPMVEEVQGDAFDPGDLTKALSGVDWVVVTLPAAGPFAADADPYADIDNLRRTIEVLECCAVAGARKLAFISSSGAVYGLLAEHRAMSEADAPQPLSPYGICKLATEHYLEFFRRKYGQSYVVYRLSNPYGPRQPVRRGQGVVAAFVRSYLNDEGIAIQGDGTASRDYIYVEDAAAMIAMTLRREHRHAVYNIGSGEQTSLNDIVALLERLLDRKVRATYSDAPRSVLQRTSITVQRFHDEFGEPAITGFAEGLRKTIESFVHWGHR
ncbi:NAD-dependent epimerase/dehydratase family protein [Dactylosporangium sp. CS-047395]|uniref:NAD-dependent epimerase/dehydratase family protein n=1 Tax=Dactylosporangium sp. CS-047395 TaxID=3239936 RepID=UPI003D9485CA